MTCRNSTPSVTWLGGQGKTIRELYVSPRPSVNSRDLEGRKNAVVSPADERLRTQLNAMGCGYEQNRVAVPVGEGDDMLFVWISPVGAGLAGQLDVSRVGGLRWAEPEPEPEPPQTLAPAPD